MTQFVVLAKERLIVNIEQIAFIVLADDGSGVIYFGVESGDENRTRPYAWSISAESLSLLRDAMDAG